MGSRDYRDIIGGLILVLAGALIASYAMATMQLGTLRAMGPGMTPAVLGAFLAIFGLIIAGMGAVSRGRLPEIQIRTPVLILASVGAFALTISRFGLIPAVSLVVVISSLADLKLGPLGLLLLCAALCAITWAIFVAGLGMQLDLVTWDP